MRASDSSRCSPSVSKANFVRTNMASLPKPFRQADFSPITVPVPPILSFQLMRWMPVKPTCRSWSARIAHTTSTSRFRTRSNHSSSMPRVTPIVMSRYCVTSGSFSQRMLFSRCACLSGGTSRTLSPCRPAIFSAMPPPPGVAAMIASWKRTGRRRLADLLQPEDAAGVVAQDGRPILRGQLQTVENLDLLFQNVVPVAAPHRGVSAEEDAPGAERAQSIAENLFQRWPARVVLPPVVGPRGVHAHVFGMVGQEQRFPEEPRPEVRDEERYFWKLLHRR